jgi:DNA-binding LacI/PurR family transcriptional regulator
MSLTRLPSTVLFSHEDGTRLGVEHLVALGHQQIALLAGPLSSVSARLRLAGWHKYLTAIKFIR